MFAREGVQISHCPLFVIQRGENDLFVICNPQSDLFTKGK